jgi:hypothetical protein
MTKLALPLFLTLFCTLALAADVEYNTTGTMDLSATLGGDRDGWGTEFITRWDNTTGADVLIEEFGWPCGGWWSQFWYVWITDTLPIDPYTLQYFGSFVAASEDDTEWPPSTYTYVDMHDEGIVIPAGASMYFGYGNPGMGGQIATNGVATYSWLEDGWDLDSDFGRTAVMQFKGSFLVSPVQNEVPATLALLGNHPNPFNPSTTISFSLPRDLAVEIAVYSLQGGLIRRLVQEERPRGTHQVTWDGADEKGRTVPSGIYLVRMVTADGAQTRKVVMTK